MLPCLFIAKDIPGVTCTVLKKTAAVTKSVKYYRESEKMFRSRIDSFLSFVVFMFCFDYDFVYFKILSLSKPLNKV